MLNRHPAASTEARPHGSGDRLLAVLALFTAEETRWSVETAAARLGVSTTTTYRYFKKLTKAGLISPVAGPAIRSDPPSSRWIG